MSARYASAIAILAATMCLSCSVQAQDSFGGGGQPQQQPQPQPQYPPQQPAYPPQQPAYPPQQPQQPQYPPQQPAYPPQQPGFGSQQPGYPQPPGPGGASMEAQDFGVAPSQSLRPSEQLHGPTPTSIPGARVIDTRALAQMLQQARGQVLLLHVLGGGMPLPGAVQATPAGMGGSFDDQTQQQYGQFLQQATNGDQGRPIVTYCSGVQCWMSYNAALRAVKLGYRNVYWYRGGLEAWSQSGMSSPPQQQGY